MKKKLSVIFVIMIIALAAVLSMSSCSLNYALKTDISKCEIAFDLDKYEYNGEEIFPNVTIKYFNKTLENSVDYDIEFFDNVNVGVGTAKISGKGKFKGITRKQFNIVDEEFLTYIFSADGAQVVNGKLTQNVEKAEQITVPIVEKRGYEFLHWTFNGQEIDFDDKSSLPNNGATFSAVFSPINYKINYVLNGGENSQLNKIQYNVEETFDLADASQNGMQFAGWYLDAGFQERFDGLSGSIGNLTLYAKFVNFEYKKLIYLLPDGTEDAYHDMVYPGSLVARREEVLSQDLTQRLVWYLDKDMTVRHNSFVMPNTETIVYSRWEEIVCAGFLDKDLATIDSFDEMVAYIEYIYFNDVTQPNRVPVTYVSGASAINAEVSKAVKQCTFPRMLSMAYQSDSQNNLTAYLKNNAEGQASVSATSREDFYPQLDSAFNNYQSQREDDFDGFAINYIDKTYPCSTSDQLFYVLSHGYRPIPQKDSAAEAIYQQFKDIMRSICDDRMSDIQKTRAIFDWLVVNIYYDNAVAYEPLIYPSYMYDAFYLEGALNGAAVCDGISKAYSVMCAIEGIDCVRVTGKLRDADENADGHAWNKVHIMGEWFLTDATWGNRVLGIAEEGQPEVVNRYEYINGEYFLFTDYVRYYVDKYNSDQYSQYNATADYNYYAQYKMELEFANGVSRIFDLYIDGDESQGMSQVEELSYVFEYIDRSGVDIVGKSFCIMLGMETSLKLLNNALNEYISRVGRDNAAILKFNIICDEDDKVDKNESIYKRNSIITIVLSLPL